jgi:energy-converting hydrogenase A subunit J
MLSVIWVAAIIVGPVTQGSLLLIFAIYAIHKIVEHNAGSSSGSPYGKLSCVRAVFSAAAEVPLFAVLIIIYFKAGTMNIAQIISYQAANGPLIYSIPLAAAMFFVLILSKAPYSPFAITKGKDIISGYETEHFGLLRGYLMMSESTAWYMLLWVFLTVFIGGLSPLWYLVGMLALSTIVGFINATTPILNPNHSIMTQVSFALIGIVGSLVLLLYLKENQKNGNTRKRHTVPNDPSAFGSVLASGLAVILQWNIVLPLTVAVFLLMILTYMLNKKGAIHFTENAENWAMIITLLAFIASFIYLYCPT